VTKHESLTCMKGEDSRSTNHNVLYPLLMDTLCFTQFAKSIVTDMRIILQVTNAIYS